MDKAIQDPGCWASSSPWTCKTTLCGVIEQVFYSGSNRVLLSSLANSHQRRFQKYLSANIKYKSFHDQKDQYCFPSSLSMQITKKDRPEAVNVKGTGPHSCSKASVLEKLLSKKNPGCTLLNRSCFPSKVMHLELLEILEILSYTVS